MKQIDLSLLHSNSVEQIKIDEDVIFPFEFYENTDIKGFHFVHVSGDIQRSTDEDDTLDLAVSGEMILLDAISLEEVPYPFSFKIEGSMKEILGNCPNTLAILELLWENIVLEVPMKFTKVSNLDEIHGDGWKLLKRKFWIM